MPEHEPTPERRTEAPEDPATQVGGDEMALDISKAFDRVWHKALLAKLPAYGFTPSFCKLISNSLSNRFISNKYIT